MMTTALIRYLTDNDVYSFSVCYLYLTKFPRAYGRYTFVDRNNTVYPPGFAAAVKEQIQLMERIIFSEEEAAFMARKCYYFPSWFYTFLRGYRFCADEVRVEQDEAGHLSIGIEGLLWKTVFWEIPVLAIVSELKRDFERSKEGYDPKLEYQRSLTKGEQLVRHGLLFAEFGSRRRFSFNHQDMVVRSLVEASTGNTNAGGRFVGSSNVYFAMKYDLTPIGTMSHQVVSFIGALFGYKEANFLAMKHWQETFDSDLGIFLYDTYGWNAFRENFSKRYAKLFDGLRVDSGDNFKAVDNIVAKYRELNIDPQSKTLTFSNGLTVEEAVAIHHYCAGKIKDSYGIGTYLTGDVTGVPPMNIVIKLTEAKLTEKKPWQKAVKLSDDQGKYTGDPDELDIARRTLRIGE